MVLGWTDLLVVNKILGNIILSNYVETKLIEETWQIFIAFFSSGCAWRGRHSGRGRENSTGLDGQTWHIQDRPHRCSLH